jgi:hypothetical protein
MKPVALLVASFVVGWAVSAYAQTQFVMDFTPIPSAGKDLSKYQANRWSSEVKY